MRGSSTDTGTITMVAGLFPYLRPAAAALAILAFVVGGWLYVHVHTRRPR